MQLLERKKNSLQKFSNTKASSFTYVPAQRKWHSNKVKTEDFNTLAENVQIQFKYHNDMLVKTIKEFQTVYDTFTILDKDYIAGILGSLQAANEANNKAVESIVGVEKNQEQIENTIKTLKQIIDVLKNFKVKIEKIEHLNDIDSLYKNFTPLPSKVNKSIKDINSLNQNFEGLISSLSKTDKQLEQQKLNTKKELEQLKKTFNTEIKNIISNSMQEQIRIEEKINKNYELNKAQFVETERKIFTKINSNHELIKSQFAETKRELNTKAITNFDELNKKIKNTAGTINELEIDTNNKLDSFKLDIDKKIVNELKQRDQVIENLQKNLFYNRVAFTGFAILILIMFIWLFIGG